MGGVLYIEVRGKGKKRQHKFGKVITVLYLCPMTIQQINQLISPLPNKGSVSDGYHTFDELYEHRVLLYILLAHSLSSTHEVWRSLLHSDGTGYEGWFILGIGKDKGRQITYHLPSSKWGLCSFAQTLSSAPEWDKHTPADVLERLKTLIYKIEQA